MSITHSPKSRLEDVGRELRKVFGAVLESVADPPYGPQLLVRVLGVDKVLASRLLKALRATDPLATVHHAPGPQPLRRILRAARRRGAPDALVVAGDRVVGEFEDLVRRLGGDRGSLTSIVAAFLPEVRREYELRHKQTAFRAMSQIRGVLADTYFSTVLLHPSADGQSIDIVWVFGFVSLTRLRPGVQVKFATRRLAHVETPRRPTNLEGKTIQELADARLDAFCNTPAKLTSSRAGDVVHYLLGDHGYGPSSAADVVMVEVNLSEMPRYVQSTISRKGHVFVEVSVPSRRLIFDAFVHADIYPRQEPALTLYDTVLDGVANVNDPARDIDKLDMFETIHSLGAGISRAQHAAIPHHLALLSHIFDSLAWDARAFRLYRCEIDYPVYGSQAVLAFDPLHPPN